MTPPRPEAPDGRRPLSVLQLHGTFGHGGKEARVVRLMNHWGDRISHDILLGDPGADGARANVDPAVTVRILAAPRLSGLPSLHRFFALARLMRHYDLILSFNWGAMDGVMAHRLFGGLLNLPPLIHHEDGFNADEAQARKALRNRYRRIALTSVDALVVPSIELAHVAAREWHQPAALVHQIPNCIDVAAYAGGRPAMAIPGLVPDGRLIVGTLAGLRPVKNLRRLVRIAAPLKDRLRLVVIGDGPQRAAIQAQAQALGLDDVVMPGHLGQPQDFLGALDIFALTSDSEQFPVALVEAMAAGLPVVATDVGDVAAMLSQPNRALVLPPDDEAGLTRALGRLIGSEELRRELGEANHRRAEECFNDRMMFELYARLYGRALGNEAILL